MALYDKRIEGDSALWRLAALRFRQGGMGTEFYAESPQELSTLLEFRPAPETLATAHLPRTMDLFEETSRQLLLEFATRSKHQIFGLVIHDQKTIFDHFEDYLKILKKINRRLLRMDGAPYIFVEYGAGLPPELFLQLHRSIDDLRQVSACLDIGHVGLWQTRTSYGLKHPGHDVCQLTPQHPELPSVIEDVQSAVEAALDPVLYMIRELGRLGKPLHVHLHDAHPLATFSPFGISDHLSFLDEIPIPFGYRGREALHLMFGPAGLSKIVNESLQALGTQQVSFMLEIHPTEGRVPLRDASALFQHWADKGNAERMNFWLSVLLKNRLLLEDVYRLYLLDASGKRDFEFGNSFGDKEINAG